MRISIVAGFTEVVSMAEDFMVEGFTVVDSTVGEAMVAGDMEEDTDKGERLTVRWGMVASPKVFGAGYLSYWFRDGVLLSVS
jgi:hypothetical protein